MKLLAGTSEQEFILDFESAEEYESFFQLAEARGYFVLNRPGLPADAVFVARAGGTSRSRKIRPQSIQPEGRVNRIQIGEPKKITPLSPRPSSATETPDDKSIPPLIERIRAMSVSDRVALALHAELPERRILMQENHMKIQEFLLRNPKITDPEIAWMAKNPSSPMHTILTILHNKGWMSVDSIRSGILTNPRTPVAIILDMIPLISAGDLIRMRQAHHLREDVQAAVRREIKKRGIRIPHQPE